MNGKRIAIACQGGGSQCAFVAGALGTLLANGVQHRSRIVGLSGTSGGAITAALAWVGLLEEARGGGMPIEDRIIGCWKDLSAQTPQEIFFDQFCLMALRMTEMGLLPSFASSPASGAFQFWSRAVSQLLGPPGVHGPRGPPRQAPSVRRLANARRPREPGSPRGGGGRARGHLQGLQLQARRDNARIRARIGGHPDVVSRRLGQRPRLLGRHLLLESADPRFLAQTADGRRNVSERDSGSSRSTAYAETRCRSSRATSSIAATI